MQANTSTAYFNSPKFDLTELTALLTLWMAFMLKGLTATLYSIADWLADQITIQFGIQGLTLTESQPKPATIEPVTVKPMTVKPEPMTVKPEPVTIEPVTVKPVTPTIEPVTPIEPVTLTYKNLQRLLKEYRDERGPIAVKLNAKRDTLEREAQRLGLIA